MRISKEYRNNSTFTTNYTILPEVQVPDTTFDPRTVLRSYSSHVSMTLSYPLSPHFIVRERREV